MMKTLKSGRFNHDSPPTHSFIQLLFINLYVHVASIEVNCIKYMYCILSIEERNVAIVEFRNKRSIP